MLETLIPLGKKAHNCFTWAREKLELLDIHFGKSLSNRIISRTKKFTLDDKGHKSQIFQVQI